jgi:hypothetical protein
LGDHIFQSKRLLLDKVDSISDNVAGMAIWDIFSVIFMLVSLRDLGVKIQEALVDRVDLDEFVKFVVNKLRDILGVVLMLVVDVGAILWEVKGVVFMILDIGAIFWEVISVVFMILELNQRASVVFLVTSVMSCLLLGIFSLKVFVMESVVVSIW